MSRDNYSPSDKLLCDKSDEISVENLDTCTSKCELSVDTTIHTTMQCDNENVGQVPETHMVFKNIPDNLTAGKIKNYIAEWRKITSNAEILTWVARVKIFQNYLHKSDLPFPIIFTAVENGKIQISIDRMVKTNIIEKCCHTTGEIICNIFTGDKKNGGIRIILNLKKLNKSVDYHHFKMDTLYTAMALVRENCFMASIDLKDAYFSIHINSQFRKYLRFTWQGTSMSSHVYPMACKRHQGSLLNS